MTSLKPGDHVIPLETPECRQCTPCLSQRGNLCTAIRATQGRGAMPDGSSRFRCDSGPIMHDIGRSTFAKVTVRPEIALAKVRLDAPFGVICDIGCGVTTGIGAGANTAKACPGRMSRCSGWAASGSTSSRGRGWWARTASSAWTSTRRARRWRGSSA